MLRRSVGASFPPHPPSPLCTISFRSICTLRTSLSFLAFLSLPLPFLPISSLCAWKGGLRKRRFLLARAIWRERETKTLLCEEEVSQINSLSSFKLLPLFLLQDGGGGEWNEITVARPFSPQKFFLRKPSWRHPNQNCSTQCSSRISNLKKRGAIVDHPRGHQTSSPGLLGGLYISHGFQNGYILIFCVCY